MFSSCEHCEMPVELYQLLLMPQPHNEAQARLEQTQGGGAYVIDEFSLTCGNHVSAPQQQPRVDQGQSQQQPLQAIGMADPGQAQGLILIRKSFVS
jgi:hypothetical protein